MTYKFLLTLIILLGWVGIATYADVCFKNATGIQTRNFLIGFLCYALTTFFAIAAFKRQEFGWIIIVWNCLSLAISLVLSVAIFREHFTLRRGVASILIAIAIILAE